MPYWLKHMRRVLFAVGLTACSGGSSDGCGGMEPLPNGFSPSSRIENAATVRVTQSGLNFLGANFGTLSGLFMSSLPDAVGGVVSPTVQLDPDPQRRRRLHARLRGRQA